MLDTLQTKTVLFKAPLREISIAASFLSILSTTSSITSFDMIFFPVLWEFAAPFCFIFGKNSASLKEYFSLYF